MLGLVLAVLQNRVAEVCRSLLETTEVVACFGVVAAVVEPGQTGDGILAKYLKIPFRMVIKRSSSETFLDFNFVVL